MRRPPEITSQGQDNIRAEHQRRDRARERHHIGLPLHEGVKAYLLPPVGEDVRRTDEGITFDTPQQFGILSEIFRTIPGQISDNRWTRIGHFPGNPSDKKSSKEPEK
jgi:hypothetical protein